MDIGEVTWRREGGKEEKGKEEAGGRYGRRGGNMEGRKGRKGMGRRCVLGKRMGRKVW